MDILEVVVRRFTEKNVLDKTIFKYGDLYVMFANHHLEIRCINVAFCWQKSKICKLNIGRQTLYTCINDFTIPVHKYYMYTVCCFNQDLEVNVG